MKFTVKTKNTDRQSEAGKIMNFGRKKQVRIKEKNQQREKANFHGKNLLVSTFLVSTFLEYLSYKGLMFEDVQLRGGGR